MDVEKFNGLSELEQVGLLIAMHIRNSMEDFHCKHLSDDQMKELNPVIRKAVMEAILIAQNLGAKVHSKEANYWQGINFFTVKMVPDYWELTTEKETLNKLKKQYRDHQKFAKKFQRTEEPNTNVE